MSLNAPLKILRLVRVPFLVFRARVTSITVVGIILHHSTLSLINSQRKALKFLAALRTNFLRDVSFTVLVLLVVDKILSFLSRKSGNVVQTVVMFLACKQALLFGRAKRVSRERASERRSREGQRRRGLEVPSG